MSEQEYQEKMQEAQMAYAAYRQAGGTECSLDWLWSYDQELFGAMQERWRYQSSYTCTSGGVMFCPRPHRRR